MAFWRALPIWELRTANMGTSHCQYGEHRTANIGTSKGAILGVFSRHYAIFRYLQISLDTLNTVGIVATRRPLRCCLTPYGSSSPLLLILKIKKKDKKVEKREEQKSCRFKSAIRYGSKLPRFSPTTFSLSFSFKVVA